MPKRFQPCKPPHRDFVLGISCLHQLSLKQLIIIFFFIVLTLQAFSRGDPLRKTLTFGQAPTVKKVPSKSDNREDEDERYVGATMYSTAQSDFNQKNNDMCRNEHTCNFLFFAFSMVQKYPETTLVSNQLCDSTA